MRTTGDIAGVLDLLPARLAEAHDDRTKLALPAKPRSCASSTSTTHRARSPISRARPPRDQLIENQLQSLAKATRFTTLGIASRSDRGAEG